MIRLTRINHVSMLLNSDLIEHAEATPDTVISLSDGQKFVVLESLDEVVDLVVEFRRTINDRFCRQQMDRRHREDEPVPEGGPADEPEPLTD